MDLPSKTRPSPPRSAPCAPTPSPGPTSSSSSIPC